MGTTLVKNYIHIVFSTYKRQNIIHENFERELYSYIASICNAKECTTIIVGGYKNHVHIFCKLSKKITLADLLREIKTNSARWLKSTQAISKQRIWQRGYGAFSVNYTGHKRLSNYIRNQKKHHSNIGFKEEYIETLKANKIEYIEKYLWE